MPLVVAVNAWNLLTTPRTVEMAANGKITFRGILRQTSMEALEVCTIEARGNMEEMMALTWDTGGLLVIGRIENVQVFLSRLRELNPYAIVQGF